MTDSCLFKVDTWFEPQHDKTNKMSCAPSEDSDQPWHTGHFVGFVLLCEKATLKKKKKKKKKMK